MTRYFTRTQGFSDETNYLRVEPDGRVVGIDHDGSEWTYPSSTLEKCIEKVQRGVWCELSAAPSPLVADSPTQKPSNELLMTRAIQMAERLKAPHTPPKGADVQFIYEQLKHVRMYASAHSAPAAANKETKTTES